MYFPVSGIDPDINNMWSILNAVRCGLVLNYACLDLPLIPLLMLFVSIIDTLMDDSCSFLHKKHPSSLIGSLINLLVILDRGDAFVHICAHEKYRFLFFIVRFHACGTC